VKLERRLAFAAAGLLVLTALGSLVFWARLSHRLPTDEDYRRANALIAGQLQPGDIIVLAPAWADRGRPFLTAAPVYSGYDLNTDTYRGTKRQWLVALADAPRVSLSQIRETLRSRGDSAAPGERIGGLWVEPFAIAGPEVAFSFTDQVAKATVSVNAGPGRFDTCQFNPAGFHQCARGDWNRVNAGWFEVEERPVHCLWAHPVDRAELRIHYDHVPLKGRIAGWGALVGRAAEGAGAPVEVALEVNGKRQGTAVFKNAFGKQELQFELPNDPSAAGAVDFIVTASNAGRRHFCFDAWVEP
jgi:hypothetical protein